MLKKHLSFLLAILLFIVPAALKSQSMQSRIIQSDGNSIVIQLFNDTAQKLSLVIFDTLGHHYYNEEINNAVLTHTRSGKCIFRDSLHCQSSIIDFNDMNRDGIKDILVFSGSGARSNPRYYLYLVNNATKKLIRIKGFEQLTNPEPDTKNKVIVSAGLYGAMVHYSFYKISTTNRLIDLKHSYEMEVGRDDNEYDKIIKLIKQHDKKKK